MKTKFAIVLVVALSLLITGCADSPERAAKDWFEAMISMDGNKILDRTCTDQRAYIQEVGLWNSVFALLPQLFGLNIKSEGDVSSLKFTTTYINTNETVANVHVYGEIRVAILAFAQAYPVNETWHMIKEDGAWRWCGVP